MANVKTFDSSQLDIKTLSCKCANINIYDIEYVIRKSYGHVHIDSGNLFNLISTI